MNESNGSYEPVDQGYGSVPADQGYGSVPADQGYGNVPADQGYSDAPINQGYANNQYPNNQYPNNQYANNQYGNNQYVGNQDANNQYSNYGSYQNSDYNAVDPVVSHETVSTASEPKKTKKNRELSPKKRVVWLVTLLTVLVILIGTQALLVGTVIRTEMVPGKWLFALIGGLALLAGIVAFLMFFRIRKKTVGLARKIIAIILAIVFAVPCYLGSQVSIKTRDAAEKVSGKTLEEIETDARTVYVLVLANDAAQAMQSTANYTYGYLRDYDVNHMPKALEIVTQAVGTSVNFEIFSDYFAMVNALYSRDIQALVIHGATIEAVCGESNYENFSSQVKILKRIPYADLLEPGETDPLKERPQSYPMNLSQMPFVFYLSGSDTRNDKLTVSRSDVNILVVVNPTTRQILMVNTPRDYHVPNPVGNGALDKLTHCGLYGPRCSMQVLEELYDVSINFYGQINFRGLETLIDAMGGVTVFSEEAFRAGNTYIQVGKNELDGASALEFARERHRVTGGDNGRGQNQMRLMEGIIEKLTSGTTILTRYAEILGSLEGMFATSASVDDISALVRFQLDEMPTWNIQSFAVTGIAGNAANYSAPGTTAYVTHIDQASVDYAAELIDRVFQNQILTESDMTLPKK